MVNSSDPGNLYDIAVVGMAGRFPGARTLDAFWRNLCEGVESVAFFSDEELLAAGVEPALLSNPSYVRAKGILEDPEYFDAQLFGYSPREASLLDPQHRLFLECAWEALENAGYDGEKVQGRVGVYAGVGLNGYLLTNLYPNRELLESVGNFQTWIGNDKDYLSTRVSYKLNLKGPSLSVQTACSSSLVAVHLACQSLLNRECRMALAGGVSVGVPHKAGYLYREGGINSPDGHCRAFDASAQGTVSGNGVGIVVLKRLEDALADGDQIDAVIKGTAINNDGALKVGYTAPSVDGQAEVVTEALAMAGVDPATITYVEAHGTATALGDPIEMAALTQAFRAHTSTVGFCAIGSVKTNIGHLDAAAGIAGLIKTILALKHRALPPSLHFERPNPQIDFASSPFYVHTQLVEWKTERLPRRAGVSSFGIGGTNAHVVLEEAPQALPSGTSRPWQLLLLSAQTDSALEAATTNLADFLDEHPQANLADAAYTLQMGRRDLRHRRILVCRDTASAAAALASRDSERVLTSYQEPGARPVVFMFPGQGAQYVGMAAELYQVEPLFREQVDHCAGLLRPRLGLDVRELLYPDRDKEKGRQGDKEIPHLLVSLSPGLRPDDPTVPPRQEPVNTNTLDQTWLAQPALFVIEYALAQLWMSWGIHPDALIGHSVGEYVAACLAGVLSLEDALALVAVRGRLMQRMPAGAMLVVPLPEHEVVPLLGDQLSLAAVNGPAQCVVSGSADAVARLAAELSTRGLASQRLHTSHAFHSAMMDPILEPFAEQVRQLRLDPPAIPYLSNLTGTWITAAEVTDPRYWVRHLRQTVRFGAGLRELLQEPGRVLLEVGPGDALCKLAGPQLDKAAGQIALVSLRHAQEPGSDVARLLNRLGQLWLAGVQADWPGFYAHERRRRIPLPTYPFERQRYWIDPPKAVPGAARRANLGKRPDIDEWFYAPAWHGAIPATGAGPAAWAEQKARWLVFLDECGLGSGLLRTLERAHQSVIGVAAGERFAQLDERTYTLNPRDPADYSALLAALHASDQLPQIVAHLWGVTPEEAPTDAAARLARLETTQERGFYSLLYLAQALGKQGLTDPLRIGVVTSGMQAVSGDEAGCPEKATVLGPCKVIPREYPNVTCHSIDIALPAPNSWQAERLIEQLLHELAARPAEPIVAYRGRHRWVQRFEPVRLASGAATPARLREGGVYLITGGLGGIDLVLADYLARAAHARLVLIGRSAFPACEDWERWLAAHDSDTPANGDPAARDAIAGTIQKLRDLEACGAQVLVLRADVADPEQMRAAIGQARERFGQIHGVIHAAGVGGGGMIQLKSREQAAAVLAPKVRGTLVLDTLLRDSQLDFLVLCSSLNPILGTFGQVDYCAANAFLDAYAYRATDGRACTTTINWAAWQAVGMAVNTAVPAELQERRNESLKQGITPEEGQEALQRVLDHMLPQVIVSPQDLHALIERQTSAALEELLPSRSVEARHPRPALASAYVAPSGAFEQTVAELWQEMFGIETLGIHDNFFALGGDSLLAVQFLNKLHKAYPVEVSLASLFEAPTVAGIAALLERAERQKASRTERPILELVRQTFPTERAALLEGYLREKVAGALKLAPRQLSSDGGLQELLPDTLMTDLIMHIKRDLQLPLYPHEIARLPSLGALAAFLVAELDRLSGRTRLGSLALVVPAIARNGADRREPSPAPARASKNKPAIFLLASPRSGSTLLRVMLAGHPALFCPPELVLLGKRSMRERNEALLHPARGHGLQRALMELKSITADEADALVAALVERDASTHEVYHLLQDLAGARTLVDKTPGYALSRDTLERAEELFEAPRYIHLVRHPYAVIESIVRNRMDRLLGIPDADPYAVAEEVWATANANVLDFLRQVDPRRQHRVYYEELVDDPATVLADLCAFLDIPFDEAVLQPYAGRRMSDGIGDPNFHDHEAIEPSLGQVWRHVKLPRRLSEPTGRLAAELSYELPEAAMPALTALPLSFAQERLWFLHQLAPGSMAYNLPKAIRIKGPLDIAILRRCLNEMVRRHEILRTSFVMVGGLPAQVIAPALPIAVPLSDLTGLPPYERAVLAERLLIEDARRPFDLARAPLLRLLLLRLAADEHALLTTPHHMIFDRWSRGVLDREIATLYEAFCAGRPAPLPDLPLQYADFARWQRQWLQGAGDHAGSPLQAQLAYWRSQLDGLATLELPTDHPRPPVETFRGAEQGLILPQRLGQALKALSQREGVTLFMTLLTAFQALLARYTGQDDIVVGSPVSQRSRTATEGLIGPFINMLVLRGDLSGDPRFRQALGRVREVTRGAYAHQDVPFEHLVRALQPARDLSRQPLFQVMFMLQNIPAAAVQCSGLTFSPLKVASGTALMDLTLIVVETANGISATLNYNTDLFEPAMIARMLAHLQSLLESATADPDQRIGWLSLLSPAERQQVLVEWNDTAPGVRGQGSGVRSTPLHKRRICLPRRHQGTKLPKHARILVSSRLRGWYLKGSRERRTNAASELLASDTWLLTSAFAAQAQRTPDAIAVVFDGPTTDQRPTTNDQRPRTADEGRRTKDGGRRFSVQPPRGYPAFSVQSLTYRELEVRANQLARYLRGLGVGPEALVGICMERSPELLVGLLGVLKAGAAYLPLDPTYPTERIAFMLEDSRISVLLTHRAIYDLRFTIYDLEESHAAIVNRKSKTVNLDADWLAIAQQPAEPLDNGIGVANTAYVIYTSGSTGTPKGVQVTHRALANLLCSMSQRPGLAASDVLVAVTTLSFDIAALELFLPLVVGGKLVIAAGEIAADGILLLAALGRCRATALQATPITWRMLLAAGWDGALRLRVLCGGEALPRDLADALLERAESVWNLYGPTETTIWSAVQRVERRDRALPIGRPIANTHVYILDRQLRPVPIGVAGELCIGGAGLARGYLHRPDLTAASFIPNPFAMTEDEGRKTKDESAPSSFILRPSSGMRLYKTGDLARYLSDGTIEFLGRRDDQVKLRGFRVELGEVEAALAQHLGVCQGVVVAHAEGAIGKRLVAYLVTSDELRVTSNQDSSLVTRHSSLVSELRSFLKERLPGYMLPATFVVLDALPLTPNGKVNRRALPAPEAISVARVAYVAPRNPTETALADIWAQVLNTQRVGIHDNFFELGGHSLLATQVMSRIRETLKVELSVRTLFETTTVAALAERIDTIHWAAQEVCVPDAETADEHEEIAF